MLRVSKCLLAAVLAFLKDRPSFVVENLTLRHQLANNILDLSGTSIPCGI